jgi:hypothetical protein
VCGPRSGGDGRPPAARSLSGLDPVADELRAALAWATTRGDARVGLAVASGLEHWWRERGLAGEGRDWMFRLYARSGASGEEVPDPELAVAYRVHAVLAGADGDHVDGLRFSRSAEAAARRTGDVRLLARVLAGRSAPLLGMGRVAEAERSCREVIAWANRTRAAADALFAVYTLALILWRRGAFEEAADVLATARPVEAARPGESGRRTVDMLLGLVALGRRDVVAAHDHLRVALRSQVTFGFRARGCETLNAIAARCAVGGDPLTATRLFGAAQALGSRLRVAPGLLGPYWREQQAASRVALGDQQFDTAYAAGAALSFDEAVAVALAVEHPDLALDSHRFSHSS